MCGWTFNQAKSSGKPAQVVRFLGLNINSWDLSFNIPEDKLKDIKKKQKWLMNLCGVHMKQLAKLVGILQSLATSPTHSRHDTLLLLHHSHGQLVDLSCPAGQLEQH